MGFLGGPTIAGGYFMVVFRGHRTGTDNQPGVQTTRSGNPNTANDFYFRATETTRQMIDPGMNTTGANGTALIVNASISEGFAHAGVNAIPASCVWEPHAGATVSGVVFIQVFRPVNAAPQTCPL